MVKRKLVKEKTVRFAPFSLLLLRYISVMISTVKIEGKRERNRKRKAFSRSRVFSHSQASPPEQKKKSEINFGGNRERERERERERKKIKAKAKMRQKESTRSFVSFDGFERFHSNSKYIGTSSNVRSVTHSSINLPSFSFSFMFSHSF